MVLVDYVPLAELLLGAQYGRLSSFHFSSSRNSSRAKMFRLCAFYAQAQDKQINIVMYNPPVGCCIFSVSLF